MDVLDFWSSSLDGHNRQVPAHRQPQQQQPLRIQTNLSPTSTGSRMRLLLTSGHTDEK